MAAWGGDVAVDQVVADALGVAVGGIAVATGAGYIVGDGVAVGDGEGGTLAVAGVAVALGVGDVDGGGSAGEAAVEAEGWRLGALAADGGGGGVAEDAPDAPDAAASAVLACAAGVGDDFVAVDLSDSRRARRSVLDLSWIVDDVSENEARALQPLGRHPHH